MKQKRIPWVRLLVAAVLLGSNARADVMAVGISAFPASSALIDFNGLPSGLEVNGLTVSGVSFDYTVDGAPVNGALIIDGGVGTTHYISPPNIAGTFFFRGAGVLGITLPYPVNLFGYGFAAEARAGGVFPFPNLTSVSAFSGDTFLGRVSFTGTPDAPGSPNSDISGGFAGVLSPIAFDRVALSFLVDPTGISPPAVDNFRYAPIPEPSTLVVVFGVGGLILRRSQSKLR